MRIGLKDNAFLSHYGPSDDSLHNFYIPALRASVRYDRSAGFFSSSALAVAAKGVAHLIQNGGRMRLMVGASLSEDDVEAIRQGHDLRERVTERMQERFTDPQDVLVRQRLEALAWMISEGILEIRVVLPRGEDGLPLAASQSHDYYHPKSGVFTDFEGNQIAFSGSVNESAQAWLHNYENLHVYRSWDYSREYLDSIVADFERLWNREEPDWISLDIPQAVKQKLLTYRPSEPPVRDPLEEPDGEPSVAEPRGLFQMAVDQPTRVIFQFLRDAPYLLSSGGLGAATSAINPWPHQTRVAQEVVRQFPERYLLSDEVGLGKTIEAGLILRQLLISGQVRRVLVLTPRSVLGQWQEELYEKFGLRVPLYDGNRFWNVYKKPLPSPSGNPWDAFPVLLAGSQLAKRTDRRKQIMDSQGWDLVLVDEAHHARRKDFKQPVYRPNRLLSLLQEMENQQKLGGLILMTATPMQVHPVEVWDLLKLLGLGARWGADEENYLRFYREIQKPYEKIDWDFVLDMVADTIDTGSELNQSFIEEARETIGPVQWSIIEGLIKHQGKRDASLKHLKKEAQPYLVELARRHTPLQRYVFRNTRSLLREYQRRGILKENVPLRKPRISRIAMRLEEQELYQRIEEYISVFYQKYEQERRGLGFIMTVYRRRLTSSFYAVRESLERRLRYLRGETSFETTFTDDDVEQDDLSLDWIEEIDEDDPRQLYQAEVEYLRDFLRELRGLSQTDSKVEHLKSELAEIFRSRPTVLVFTQYTDTMDYLREQLRVVYGRSVACYSGRGGEIWNGTAWTQASKDVVKEDFKLGNIRILLCTESASEGLNLQSCGALINYDMPWNPMRVEQRIGRIDRIGQMYPDVWIHNYFYRDTIEDAIYSRLADRIRWFEVVVGDLQPILAEVGQVTQRLAMLPVQERAAQLKRAIHTLQERLDHREIEALDLDKFSHQEDPNSPPTNMLPTPVSLAQIETLLTTTPPISDLFQKDPVLPRAYLLRWNDTEYKVTFDPECFDKHSTELMFLTYGNTIFEELLELVAAPDIKENSGIVRLKSDGDPAVYQWVVVQDGKWQEITNLHTLESKRNLPQIHAAPNIEPVQTNFEAGVKAFRNRQIAVKRHRVTGAYLAVRSKAQRLLVQAALIEITLGRQKSLFDSGTYPAAFNEQAVRSLGRHGYPWGALVQSLNADLIPPAENDPYYLGLQNRSVESLRGKFSELSKQARELLTALVELQHRVREFEAAENTR